MDNPADWITALDLLREEHAMLAFDNQIMTVEQGDLNVVLLNRDAAYFYVPNTILLATAAH